MRLFRRKNKAQRAFDKATKQVRKQPLLAIAAFGSAIKIAETFSSIGVKALKVVGRSLKIVAEGFKDKAEEILQPEE